VASAHTSHFKVCFSVIFWFKPYQNRVWSFQIDCFVFHGSIFSNFGVRANAVHVLGRSLRFCTVRGYKKSKKVIENCVDINSTQFDADLHLFKSIRHHGFKKIHLALNSTQKALNCVFRVVYGKFIPI